MLSRKFDISVLKYHNRANGNETRIACLLTVELALQVIMRNVKAFYGH